MSAASPEPWTVLRLLNWTKDHFVKSQVPEPRLSAEVLLAHALGCKRIELYTRVDYVPKPAELDAYRESVRRAGRHEPVAYLVGTKEFYSLPFKVTSDVLIPRPETEMLVQQALEVLKRHEAPLTVWDACTGSGCVAIAIARQRQDVQVVASDISPGAVAVADENARALKVADRVRCRVADGLALPDDCGDLAPFAVITANPPYIRPGEPVAECVRHEPEVALYGGADGYTILRPLIADAPARLRPEGALILEFGIEQADDVRDMVLATGEFFEPTIEADMQGLERICVAVRK